MAGTFAPSQDPVTTADLDLMRRWLAWTLGALLLVTLVGVTGRLAYRGWCDHLRFDHCLERAEPDDLATELFLTDLGWVNFGYRAVDGDKHFRWEDFQLRHPNGRVEGCGGDDSTPVYIAHDEERLARFYVACATESPPGEYTLLYRGVEMDRLAV